FAAFSTGSGLLSGQTAAVGRGVGAGLASLAGFGAGWDSAVGRVAAGLLSGRTAAVGRGVGSDVGFSATRSVIAGAE
ncbi:MAG: hypothetical protein WBW03_08285, partial [Silvibacterium sp.]